MAMSQLNQLPAPEAAWDGADGREGGGGTVRLGKPGLSRSAQAGPEAPPVAPSARLAHDPPVWGGVSGPHAGRGERGPTPFPVAGDELFGYRIRGELGRG